MMQDDPPQDDVDEFDGMLDDAPTTPPNMYGENDEIFVCCCAGGGVSRYCTGPLFSKFRRLKGRDTMKRRDVDDFLVFFIVWPISFVVWGFISFGCQCVFVFPNSGLEVLGYILLFTLVGGLFGAWGMGRFYRWVTKV